MYNLSFGDARMKVIAGDLGQARARGVGEEHRDRAGGALRRRREVRQGWSARDGESRAGARAHRGHLLAGDRHPRRGAAWHRASRASAAIANSKRSTPTKTSSAISRPIANTSRRPVDHSLVLTLATRELPECRLQHAAGNQRRRRVERWHADDELVVHRITGAMDSARSRNRQGEHGHRLAFHAGRCREASAVQRPSVEPRDAAPDPSARPALSRAQSRRSANTNLVWKDTAIIPAGETVDLLVDMSNPGRWMLHCHVAEHLSAGMMAMFTVSPRDQKTPAKNVKARSISWPGRHQLPFRRLNVEMRRNMSVAMIAIATALVAIAAPLCAQSRVLNPEVTQYVDVNAHVVAITHAKLVDGSGAPARNDQTIVIRGDKIAAVGSSSRDCRSRRRTGDRRERKDRDPGHHRAARSHVLRRDEVHGRELSEALPLRRRDDDPHHREASTRIKSSISSAKPIR